MNQTALDSLLFLIKLSIVLQAVTFTYTVAWNFWKEKK